MDPVDIDIHATKKKKKKKQVFYWEDHDNKRKGTHRESPIEGLNNIPIPRAMVLSAPGNAPDILQKNPMWSLTAWSVSGRR